MRLPDDDELYEVDQTYLGPPGRYIGVMRHKTIFAALVILPLLFVTARRLGIPATLLSVGLILIGGIGLSMFLADQTSGERPFSALAVSFWRDVNARREPSTVQRARGTGFLVVRNPTGAARTPLRRPPHDPQNQHDPRDQQDDPAPDVDGPLTSTRTPS